MKRLFDIIISSVALLILSPVAFVVSLFVRAKIGSPILFRQLRPGKNGDSFEMIKFRSMLNAVGKDGNPLPDEDRLTRFKNLVPDCEEGFRP